MARTGRDPRVRLLAIGAVLLAAGISAGVYLLRDRPPTCGGATLTVTVAAAPDIAPALADVAERFNVQGHDVGGSCARVTVRTRDPAQVARDLARHRPADADGWVPDSSMWIDLVRAGGAPGVGPGTSVATSPVVIAAPRAVAAELRHDGVAASWRLVAKPPLHAAVRALDPARDAAGAATTLALRATIDRDAVGATSKGRTGAGHGARRVRVTREPDPARLFQSFAGLPDLRRPLAVTSERSVVAYNDTHRPNPAAVIVPKEGTILLDHPITAITTDHLRQQAVDAFRWTLSGGDALDVLQRYGLRTPDGSLDRHDAKRLGLPPRPPKILPKPTPAQATALLGRADGPIGR